MTSSDPTPDQIADGMALWQEHRPQNGADWVRVAERFIADGATTEQSSAIFAGLVRAVRERDHFARCLRYYADETHYNEDGAPVYESLSPPEGWVGEEYEATTKLDEGQLAREALGIDLELLHPEDQTKGPF